MRTILLDQQGFVKRTPVKKNNNNKKIPTQLQQLVPPSVYDSTHAYLCSLLYTRPHKIRFEHVSGAAAPSHATYDFARPARLPKEYTSKNMHKKQNTDTLTAPHAPCGVLPIQLKHLGVYVYERFDFSFLSERIRLYRASFTNAAYLGLPQIERPNLTKKNAKTITWHATKRLGKTTNCSFCPTRGGATASCKVCWDVVYVHNARIAYTNQGQ